MSESEFLSRQIQRVFDRFVLPTIDKFVANVDCYDVEKLEPTIYREGNVIYVKVKVKLNKKGYNERNMGLYESIATLLFNGARNIITSDEYVIIEVSYYTMSSKLIYSTQLGSDDRLSDYAIKKYLNVQITEEITRIQEIMDIKSNTTFTGDTLTIDGIDFQLKDHNNVPLNIRNLTTKPTHIGIEVQGITGPIKLSKTDNIEILPRITAPKEYEIKIVRKF